MKKDKGSDQLGERLRRVSADLKLYLEKRMELMMLNAGEYFSGWMAASVQRALGVLLLLGGLGFILFALAIYLGDLLNSDSLGYLIVSLPLLLTGGGFLYLKPARLFERLQQMFEAEVIKAVNKSSEAQQKKLESKETLRSEIEKKS